MELQEDQITWITFDKGKYHLNEEMQSWCRDHIGEGQWLFDRYPKDWTGLKDWTIHSMFGNTTFAFKNPKHFTLFILRWGLE